jgi:hypothetical protein
MGDFLLVGTTASRPFKHHMQARNLESEINPRTQIKSNLGPQFYVQPGCSVEGVS